MPRRFPLLVLVPLLLALPAPPPAHAARAEQLIVKLHEEDSTASAGALTAIAQDLGGSLLSHTPGIPYLLVSRRKGARTERSLPPEVAWTEPVTTFRKQEEERMSALSGAALPSDPLFARQWHLQETGFGIGLPSARARSQGEGVIVAVVDTGVREDLPDFAGIRFLPGFNAIDNSTNARDDNGHGSHVAGTIAETTDNGLGAAGIAPRASILPVKALAANGQGSNYSIAVGIRWAADNGARVINLSLGGAVSRSIADAIAYASGKGIVVCAASGNQGRGTLLFPSSLPECIAVGALDRDGRRASFSNYGEGLALVAPGVGVVQQTFDRGTGRAAYRRLNGTSMATPHVAGTAALLLSLNSTLSPLQVRRLLTETALPLRQGRVEIGAGSLSAAAAVARAAADLPSPTPPPVPELPPVTPPVPEPMPPMPAPVPIPAPVEVADVLARVNRERASVGAAPLVLQEHLIRAAQAHAEDMAAKKYFSHTGLDGRGPGDRIRDAGYRDATTWGENIAWGQRTPENVMDAWMASPGHRANILRTGFQEIGIGLARDSDGRPYWVQTFGARR